MRADELPVEMTISELAVALGLRRHVVRDYVRNGQLPTRRRGPKKRRIVIPLIELRDAMPSLWEELARRLLEREDDDS